MIFEVSLLWVFWINIVYPTKKKKKREMNVDITTYVWGLAEFVFAHEY